MAFRDPHTGRFITRERWEQLQEERMDEYEDWEDLDEFDYLGEDEY